MSTIESILNYLKTIYSEAEYPALAHQIAHWKQSAPLANLEILDATPIFGNTMLKYVALLSGGAKLTIGVSAKIPKDDRIVDFLRSISVRVVDDSTPLEFDVVMDCAAAFSEFPARVGYVELTRSGVDGYQHCQKPVFLADSGRIKRIETSLGTGEGYFRAMDRLGYNHWSGRSLVVFGSGKVGRGIVLYAERRGAVVTVVTNPADGSNLKCNVVDCHDKRAVETVVENAYAVVSATGVPGALAPFRHSLNQSKALIANMGVEDEFGESFPSSRVLNHKEPLNFLLEEPTLLRYIDATMALDNAGALYLISNTLPNGLIMPPIEMEEELLAITKKSGLITDELERI